MSYVNRRGTNSSIRRMTTRQQASDVLSYGYIVTTRSRGKLTQRQVERIITMSKRGTLEDRRRIAAIILRTAKYDRDALLRRICTEVADRYRTRRGGCTRLLKMQKKDRVLLSLV